MKTRLFILFGVISLVFGALFLRQAWWVYKDGRKAKRVLSPIHVYTIGVFCSVMSIFIPIYYTCYNFGDNCTYIRPILLAFHNTLRIFILDADFDIVVTSLKGQNVILRVCFSAYSAFLYVIAPFLTFGNVLSLFKNIKGEIRYKWHKRKKHYIMSELNEKSIALARSIYNKQKDIVIVFADVFEQNQEYDYELLTQAYDINAICLKKDVSHIDFFNKKCDVEVFLIGNDESENVSQAVKITTELNKKNSKYNVKVFVFSTKPSAAYIIDSIKYDNLLKHASEHGYGEDCFRLRRIDERHQLIWNTVPKMELFNLAARNDNTLPVLIVGFGSYGIELFKTLVWYCQFEGYKLQISIVDKRGKNTEDKNCIESVINRESPELLKKNGSVPGSDDQYDIKIFPGVDVLTADLDELFLFEGTDSEKASMVNRLKATNLAFVSLGDDDINIEVSIRLRSLFDRIGEIKANKDFDWKDENVEIYSVVYDDQKSSILYNEYVTDSKSHLLLNHKDVPYHIHFIGGMSAQFDYNNIYDAELEKCAYEHHRGWVNVEEAIYNEWKKTGDKEKLENHEWYFWGEKNEEAATNARKKYEQYEYYRLSSIAKELYQREIRKNSTLLSQTACLETEKLQTCKCKNCIRRKRSEHMRWNAYTRVTGYSYNNGIRADRALLHDKLCEWEQLSELDQLKD